MKKLNLQRKKIDRIDRKLAQLFEKRMKVASEIAHLKKEKNLPIFDANREEEICKRETEYIKSSELKPFYLELLQKIMELSKKWQALQ